MLRQIWKRLHAVVHAPLQAPPLARPRKAIHRRPFGAFESLESRALLSVVPNGFQETQIISGLNPTAADFAPDGRLFVAEKTGRVRIVQNDQLVSTPFYTVPVDIYRDRGLTGIVVDPNYAQNRFVYIYYTAAVAVNPNAPDNGAPTRLVRLTASAANPNVAEPGSEVVVIDGFPSPAGIHTGSFLGFGADGYLYLGVGDGSSGNAAQNLNSLQGKVLRLDVSQLPYQIPADNPYVGQAGKRGEIWASGFRNPYSGSFQDGTNTAYINDVGNSLFEEVNQLIKGANYGWPLAEGNSINPLFTNPLYAYPHVNGGAAVTGGDFYTATNFPPRYWNTYFSADIVQGVIRNYDPATDLVTFFATGVGFPVDLDIGPDGSLYYLTKQSTAPGQGVVKIRYVTGNRAPTAVAAADSVNGAAPFTANFSATGSSDPDGDPLTYSWDFGDGESGTGLNVSHTYLNEGTYQAVLTVNDRTDGTGLSGTSTVTISVGNLLPVATILTPLVTDTYQAGTTISFSGSGTDFEDGDLPASALTWSFLFGHNTHTHDFIPPLVGVTSGSFFIPTTGELAPDQYYRVILTVTDSEGLTRQQFVDIRPQTANFTLATSPPGLSLKLDDQPGIAPFTTTGVVGMERIFSAAATRTVNGVTYEFTNWSDDVLSTDRTVTLGAADTTYTAVYRALGSYTASFTSTAPSTWGTKSTRNYNVTLTNTGTASWSSSGPGSVKLAIYFGGVSDEPGTWSEEPQYFTINGLEPSQSITLNVNVTAPVVANGYVLRHRIVRDDTDWQSSMQKLNAYVVVPTLAAAYTSTPPTQWNTLTSQAYTLTLQNTGTQTWNATGTNRVRVGVYFGGYSDAPNIWTVQPQRVDLPNDVAPGETVTVTVRPILPTSGGTLPLDPTTGGLNYVLRTRLVKENVGWFDYLQKSDALVQTISASYTGATPAMWLPGETKTFPVTLTNTGNTPWNFSGVNNYNLGAYFGGSSDAVGAWPVEPTRVPLTRDVNPGESITLSVTATAPVAFDTTNSVLRLRMVKEGVGWFNQMQKTNLVFDTVGTYVASYANTSTGTWGIGSTRAYNVTVSNLGTATWSATGPNAVKLGVYFGGVSDDVSTATGTPQQFSLPIDVAPGQTITLTINVVGPAVANGYVLRHRMVRAGDQWFAQMQRLNATVAAPTLSATYTGTPPTIWNNLLKPTYTVTLLNTGTQTWNATGTNQVRLGIYFGGESDAANAWTTQPQRFTLPNDVAPGQSVTLAVKPVMPNAVGPYILRARLVKENVAWFDYLQKSNVTVEHFVASYAGTSPPANWVIGQPQTYSFTVTNTGRSVWNAGGANPISLGVYFGGVSDAVGDWSAEPIRVPLTSDLLPGQSQTLSVTLTAPPVANGYVLRHRMVRDGIGWFDQMRKTNVTVRV